MSRVEAVKSEIEKMSSHELAAFRSWFAEYEAELWDEQIEADAKSGRLQKIATLALREHTDGLSTDL